MERMHTNAYALFFVALKNGIAQDHDLDFCEGWLKSQKFLRNILENTFLATCFPFFLVLL